MNIKPTALDAYRARTAAIHAKLERLQQLADDHFGHNPDAIHWGHVGDLGRAEARLDELLAIFGGDGEWLHGGYMGRKRKSPLSFE